MKRRPARAKDDRGAPRNINDGSKFTQPPLKVVEVRFQVAAKRRRFAGRGYDGRAVRVER